MCDESRLACEIRSVNGAVSKEALKSAYQEQTLDSRDMSKMWNDKND